MSLLPLPPTLAKRYPYFRFMMYIGVFAVVAFFAERSLFPVISYSFDFQNPKASRNNLLEPRNQENAPEENGRLAPRETLLINAGSSGIYDEVLFTLLPESETQTPDHIEATLRRGYRATWLPEAEPQTNFTEETLYFFDQSYYTLRDNTLFRFVSEEAFLSRFPKEKATITTPQAMAQYPISEKTLGFRPGMLVAFADGIFLIMDEEVMRPIGSVRIFLGLGYRFEDVKYINAEELGIYKTGKVFLSGDIHPDGTVFEDTDTQNYFVLEDGKRHPLPASPYRDFLLSQSKPITYSSLASLKTTKCLTASPLLSRKHTCTLPLAELKTLPGNDYELRFTNPSQEHELDIQRLTLDFSTEKSAENLFFLLSQQKDLLLTRLGLL